MQRFLMLTAISLCLISIAHHACAADKSTTTSKTSTDVTISTRTLPPVQRTIFDVNIHRIREPAPANPNCARPSFEPLNRYVNERRCINNLVRAD